MRFATILSTALSAATFAVVAQDATIISANATLKDGSTVKGEFTTKRITGSTIFTEKLELDPALVKTVAFASTNGESKVELNNGDKFAMRIGNDNFAIKSLLGELNIPRTNFRSITLSSRKISAGGCDDGSSGSKEPRSALESRRVSLGAHWVDSRESSLLRRLERGREIGL